MADTTVESKAKELDRSDATVPTDTSKPVTLDKTVQTDAAVLAEKTETVDKKKCRSKRHKKEKQKKRLRKKKVIESSDESDTTTDTESSDDSSSESEDLPVRRRHKTKSRRTKKHVVSSSSDPESSDDEPKKSKKRRQTKSSSSEDEANDNSGSGDDAITALKTELEALKLRLEEAQKVEAPKTKLKSHRSKSKKEKKAKKATTYQRVDQIWDDEIHNYKLKETNTEENEEFAEYAFVVRRRFTYENEYVATVVDIKAKQLKKALAEVMKDCKSISLDVQAPTIDPHLLFLYVEQIRTYYKKTLKTQIKAERKKKALKKLELRKTLCKSLVSYIDKDYADVKKTLFPLIEAGNITFELAWALFRPNEPIVCSTYGMWEHPRAFRIDYAHKMSTFSRGEFYSLEGKILDYDGKSFGLGDFEVDIDNFKGVRRIDSLAAYPLKYHKQAASVRQQLIDRGRHFIQLEGMNYRQHTSLAFLKKKKQVLKININGRVMIDPATFRRINPNYPVSALKSRDSEDLFSDSEYSSSDSDSDSSAAANAKLEQRGSDNDEPKVKYEYVKQKDGSYVKVSVEVDEDGNRLRSQKVDGFEATQSFTDDDLLITTSVVLGFAFSEKLWLEFTVAGLNDIVWNSNAFDSLVLPPNQKSIVKALVESHSQHAAKTIDDVVQGKGKGRVFLLHGKPGIGKTLTAESMADLLKVPLYSVSAGELGIDAARLEAELNRVLDCASVWNAVLLIDEADIFMEQRQVADVHRNALVSIFLRTLEYYTGLMILTTNRVETFDEAFQSRIHVGLRYESLSTKAKKHIWKMFIDMCKKQEGNRVEELSEHEFDMLSRHNLNGRQIKNLVSTAQALALNEGTALGLAQIKRVLEVAEDFETDLKGGTGYVDAMHSYT